MNGLGSYTGHTGRQTDRQSFLYIRFHDSHVLQLRSETVVFCRRMNTVVDHYGGQMIPVDECSLNFLTFVLRLRKTPENLNQETDPIGDWTRASCMIENDVTPRLRSWSRLSEGIISWVLAIHWKQVDHKVYVIIDPCLKATATTIFSRPSLSAHIMLITILREFFYERIVRKKKQRRILLE